MISRAKRFFSDRNLLTIFLVGLALRLLWFFYVLSISENGFLLADSTGYINIASNSISGNGYSMSDEAPFYPDVFRPPFLPGLLILCGNQILVFLFLQIVAGSFTAAFTYQLALRLTQHRGVALFSGWMIALDIPSIVFSNLVMGETFFTLFLLLAIATFFTFRERGRNKNLLWSSLFLGLAAMIRPIGILFPFFFSPLLLLVCKYRKNNWTKALISFFIPFLLLTGTWIARNQIQFGKPFFSHISSFNLAYFSAADIYKEVHGGHINEARLVLYEEAMHGMKETPYNDPGTFYPRLRNRAIQEITQHPFLFFKNAFKANIRLFFYPMSGFINQTQTGLGPDEAWKITTPYPLTRVLVVLQIIVILSYAIGVLFCLFFIRNRQWIGVMLILFFVLAYFSLTGLGTEMEARFRIPAMPYIALCSAMGWMSIKSSIKKQV
jgi:hypothetical protein